MKNIDLQNYQRFVTGVTSEPSMNTNALIDRLQELSDQHPNINVSLLLTSAIGMPAEIGEFSELPKKIVFQGKPITEETIFHMKRELGDVIFYWMNACTALGINPQEVIDENVNKLSARYPGGFTVERSENRAEGDI